MNGYIRDEIQKDHWLGAIGDIIVPDRDWRPYMGRLELQRRNGLETNGCTNFNTDHALEMLLKQKGVTYNSSDRYSHIRTGTSQNGNTAQNVIETTRKYIGLIPEGTLGFTDDVDTWDEYKSGLLFGHKKLGAQFLSKWEINHSWVVDGSETNWQDAMYDALQFSPLGAAVQAWSEDQGMYVRRGQDTHWTVIVGAKKGSYWRVCDSYDPQLKKLEWNYYFDRVKQYSIKPRESYDIAFLLRVGQGLLGTF